MDLKIERVMKRNSVSKTDVEKRIHAQWTDEQKEAFKNANKVRVSSSGYMSISSYGFEVRID